LRNELKNSKKIYFFDNGIRNAVITNFNQLENRSDIGALWENFIVSERIKYLNNNSVWVNYWYWRTKEQKEIDFIEEADGKISAYEFKWNPNSKFKLPKQFLNAYKNSIIKVINSDNYDNFIL
jgi:hypothetical protein